MRLAILLAALAGLAAAETSELRYVLVLTRHGVRAPTWPQDRLRQYSTADWPDFGVKPAELTPHGRLLMKQFGEYYGKRFRESGLLKGGCDSVGKTYIHVDLDQRTIETGRALAEGLYPGCTVEVHSAGKSKVDELFDPLEAGVVKPDGRTAAAAVMGRVGTSLDAVNRNYKPEFDALVEVLTGGGKAAKSIFDEKTALKTAEDGVTMTGPLRLASTFTENLLLEYATGMKGEQLGWGRLNKERLTQMMTLHTVYADLMRRTPYLAAQRGGKMFQTILASLDQAATGKAVAGALGIPSTKLVVISGHDTNISNLSGLLGLSWMLEGFQKDDVPPGGALVFSLWKKASAYSVTMEFLTQSLDDMHEGKMSDPLRAPLFISECSSGVDGYPCSLDAFQRGVKAHMLQIK